MSNSQDYDFLIIGAGSAGCVLANRLSANPANRVLLIEAGGNDSHPYIRMPAGVGKLVGDSRFNWDYYTEPQQQLNNRRLYWPRGKLVGGSSSINAMCYVRGQSHDYNEWAHEGLDDWSYEHVLPVFKRSENFAGGANRFHGDRGPLHVQKLRYRNPLTEVFLHAGEQAGYPANGDFNGARQEGIGEYHVTQDKGKRCSASAAFLHPIKQRSNLTIWRNSMALAILFDGERAVGARIARESDTVAAYAGHVVLCGGAINTPQLLMLSGVGPADHLRQFGIEVVANRREVGANLHDHLDICTLYKSRKPITYDFSRLRELAVGARYLFGSGGPGSSNVAEAGGFVRSDLAQEKRPDIQLHFVPAQLDDHGRNKLPGHGFTLHACVLRPKSRGEIRLKSRNPMSHPALHANYLSHPHDLALMIEAVKISHRILNQPAFDPYRGASVFEEAESKDHDVIAGFIRRKAESVYHPVGTCRMGVDSDAVVSSKLTVNGVTGLTVADASVMPRLVSGNTNAPTMMIAERAADILVHGMQH